MDNFKITLQGNSQVTFANGVTVSLFIGTGAYITGRGKNISFYMSRDDAERRANNCEIAIFDKNGDWITKKWKNYGDDVVGWQSPEQYLEALNWASKYQEDK